MQQPSLARCKTPYVRPREGRGDLLAVEHTSWCADGLPGTVAGTATRPALSGQARIQATYCRVDAFPHCQYKHTSRSSLDLFCGARAKSGGAHPLMWPQRGGTNVVQEPTRHGHAAESSTNVPCVPDGNWLEPRGGGGGTAKIRRPHDPSSGNFVAVAHRGPQRSVGELLHRAAIHAAGRGLIVVIRLPHGRQGRR